MNCWDCYKLVGHIPQQMRLACLELLQVQWAYRALQQVNQFYLVPVRRTKVLALLFHQMCLGASQWPHQQVCCVIFALTLAIASVKA